MEKIKQKLETNSAQIWIPNFDCIQGKTKTTE